MNLQRLADIASLVTVHSGHLIDARAPISDRLLRDYFKASQDVCRLWREALNEQTTRPVIDPIEHGWATEKLVSEIFVAEVLIRVWTATLVAADSRFRQPHAAPVVRYVLNEMLEIRRQSLRLLVDGVVMPLGCSVRVDRLRRKCERWSDLLVGRISSAYDVLEFAVDQNRAADYVGSMSDGAGSFTEWTLTTAGMRNGFPPIVVSLARQVPLGAMIHAMFEAFPPETFDEHGLMKSALQRRVESERHQGDSSIELQQVYPPILGRETDHQVASTLSFRDILKHPKV
ncbi:MAG: hypothetical protein R3C01_00135 [Planctomycetaceae bacterium]